ncbi:MAG: sigma-70 family RNA polymerase sigma factor [Ruminococcaceae bacterium]|nr:sigma-70 family RNA polymerase sigma factor [Oscillospiraceae bacterium]
MAILSILFCRLRAFFGELGIDPQGEIFYINGSDELPPPLDGERERECIEAMTRGEKTEYHRNLLVEHNLRLVVYIAKKFENSGVGMEDLISIGTIGLMKGVTSFRADKNIKLATYCSKCVENEILMFLRKLSTRKNEISIDEPLNVDFDGNELLLGDILGTDGEEIHRELEREEDFRLLFSALKKLSSRDRDIIVMRFGLLGQKELTQKEVADRMGISQSYISRLEKKIIARLKKEISAQN